MTELLFHKDSYLREFDARVVAVDGERAAFDRTAFYPTGGGQPCDRGVLLVHGAHRAAVDEVRREGPLVWHTAPGHQLAVGDAVHGSLDWERRYGLMRTHTALHVLSAVIWRDYGSQVTGGNMEPLRARMDFELVTMHADFVQAVSAAVEEEIRADRPIAVRSVSRAEAEGIPDLIRTKINLLPADITMVRTVNIVGLDLQADGGTHVARTGEVGAVRVVDYHSKGKANKRIVIEIADR
jgi:misacylated tRNA(Ala) deacylase